MALLSRKDTGVAVLAVLSFCMGLALWLHNEQYAPLHRLLNRPGSLVNAPEGGENGNLRPDTPPRSTTAPIHLPTVFAAGSPSFTDNGTDVSSWALPTPSDAGATPPSVTAVASATPADPATPTAPVTPVAAQATPAPAIPPTLVRGESPLPQLAFESKTDGFSLHKLGTGAKPTLLVVGGIQGDEPGGFSAATLLASHYKITAGTVWVVPDLNYPSIMEHSRGVFGDLNRKFAALEETDPQYPIVSRIKSILQDDAVDLILNLHDGSGFYRPTWETAMRNPKRWGQSVIIDQEEVGDAERFNSLAFMAAQAEQDVNKALLHPEHRYHIRNTNTRLGDKEMEKTLSYFAVCNGKPAFGIEASKEFSTEYRIYYHILVIESFMRQMGITFERDFPLTPTGVLAALNSNLLLSVYNGKIILPLENIRPYLNMVPFKKGVEPDSRATKPLIGLVRDGADWRVAYGNRTLTRLRPEEMDFDDSLTHIDMVVDGKPIPVYVGEIITVTKSFTMENIPGYRVNAIGAQKEKNGTEAGVVLERKDFMPRFSVDKDATVFRVEIYKDKAFAGMILVDFAPKKTPAGEPLTAATP